MHASQWRTHTRRASSRMEFFCSSHLCLCAQGFFVSGWRSNWMRLARMRAATPSKNMFRRFTREIGHTHTAMQNKNDKKRRGEKSGWRDEHELSTEYRDCSTQNTLASCTIRNAITINAMDSNGAHTRHPSHDIRWYGSPSPVKWKRSHSKLTINAFGLDIFACNDYRKITHSMTVAIATGAARHWCVRLMYVQHIRALHTYHCRRYTEREREKCNEKIPYALDVPIKVQWR